MEENDNLIRFKQSIETRIKDMNNLLHYNQFTNEEIRRLEAKEMDLLKKNVFTSL